MSTLLRNPPFHLLKTKDTSYSAFLKLVELSFVLRVENGLGPPTGEPAKRPPKSHDIIEFFPNTKDRIFEICAPLYAQGLSLREIERQTGFAKTSIRKTLNSRGLVLRNYHNRQKPKSKDQRVMKPGTIPYGYAYLEGMLVKDPKEYKIVLQIQKLWKSGKSCAAIATGLNNQKTPTRMGGRWGKSVIARILKRYEIKELRNDT